MSPAIETTPEEQIPGIAAQLINLLERASRRQDLGREDLDGLPGLPGAKRPDEEVLVAA